MAQETFLTARQTNGLGHVGAHASSIGAGPYDFYTLVTCLLILLLQIHNPFQAKQAGECQCSCDGRPAAASASAPSGAPRSTWFGGAPSPPASEPPEPAPVYKRPREAMPVAQSTGGMSTDSLLRELDSIQAKAKEQQDTLAAAGRMPPGSPILQQLKERDAELMGQGRGMGGIGMQQPSAPLTPQAAATASRPPSMPPGASMPGGIVPAQDLSGAYGVPLPDELGLRRRSDLGRFLQQRQPRGLGVVLGVGRGEFAIQLLQDWQSAQGIYLVDPFIHIRGYDDPSNIPDRDHQVLFEDLRNRLAPYEGRHILLRDFSYSFADAFQRGGSGVGMATFVFVDANHGEEAVTRDLDAWWPLVAQGGLLAGSAYADSADGRIRVRTAVDRFASQRQLRVYLTAEDQPPTWCIFKA